MGLKVFALDVLWDGAATGGDTAAGREGAGSGLAQASLEPQASMLEKLDGMADAGVALDRVG